MKIANWKWMPVLAGLVFGLTMLPVAGAQCGGPLNHTKPMSWQAGSALPHLERTVFFASEPDEDSAPSIVGMWHIVFTAHTLNGAPIPATVIDNALTVWHSDNTEILNSGRPPQDGNFCLGVWEKTGKLTYRVNHFAWAANNYAPGTAEGIVGAPIGPVHYKEEVHLNPDGKHYSGTFTLDQYDTTGNIAVSFTGSLQATRITLDTTVNDLL